MESELCKSAHKAYRIKYHFVFCIKYRKDLFLTQTYVETLKQICKDFEQRYHLEFETIGFDEDHVHFMIQSVPKYSASQIFRLVKSITASQLFEKYPEIKKELWGGHLWSPSYYVGTAGNVSAETIQRYIERSEHIVRRR